MSAIRACLGRTNDYEDLPPEAAERVARVCAAYMKTERGLAFEAEKAA